MATLDSEDLTNIARSVWEYAYRTLTFSPQNLASITDGDALSLIRGNTFTYEFTGIDMDNYEQAFFTIKKNYKDNDYESLLMVSSGSGVIYLNGVRKTDGESYGTITSGSASLNVKIQASATKNIPYSSDNYYYDLQVTTSGSVTTPYIGEITLIRDVTNRTT